MAIGFAASDIGACWGCGCLGDLVVIVCALVFGLLVCCFGKLIYSRWLGLAGFMFGFGCFDYVCVGLVVWSGKAGYFVVGLCGMGWLFVYLVSGHECLLLWLS